MTLVLPKVPQNIDNDTRLYLQNLTKAVSDHSRSTITKEQPVDSILLVSPNGSVYAVGVDDTGALTTTQLSG
jgi:hypothetical protein